MKRKKATIQNVSSKTFVKNKTPQVATPQVAPKYTIGITAADQFNIVLFHASYVEKEWSFLMDAGIESSAYDAFDDKTKSVHIISPMISIKELPELKCAFERGRLYRISAETVTFFSTGEMNKQWPDEWHAVDVFLSENDVVLFLGIVQYELTNTITKRKSDVYVLKFLHNETIIQYPIFQHTYKDFSEFGENVRFAAQQEKIEREMNTILADKMHLLEP